MNVNGPVQIIDLRAENEVHLEEAASVLVAGFKEFAPAAWPDIASARAEVDEALAPGKICRAAMDQAGRVVGWIGGIPSYRGRVWELHPLVVDPACQRTGIGRALIADLEGQVRERGGLTMTLGTDDVGGQTSLSGIDLYPNIGHHIQTIRNVHNHPFEFYQKCGFAISGLVPDANGYGKPDIIMSKRMALK